MTANLIRLIHTNDSDPISEIFGLQFAKVTDHCRTESGKQTVKYLRPAPGYTAH